MLNQFQCEIINVLTLTRNEKSYFAGGTVLNFELPRYSSDFDIFHDDHTECMTSFVKDVGVLRQYGYTVEPLRSPDKDGIGEIRVIKGNEQTEIQWVTDSAYRFFPVEKDMTFGFRLNYHDLATNKLLALAGRSEIRDYYDVCTMIKEGKPVVAYVWAACGKDPGYTPSSLLDAISFHSKHQKDDFLLISHGNGYKLSITDCKNLFLKMLYEAEDRFKNAPVDEYGCLYLRRESGDVFFPSREDFIKKDYIKHEARTFGSFPVIKQDTVDELPCADIEETSRKRHRMR